MHNEFEKLMSQKSDIALIRITTLYHSQYEPAALEAAKSELGRRNIDDATLQRLTLEAAEEYQRESALTTDYDKATGIQRFVHMLVDTIAIYVLTLICTIVIGLITGTVSENTIGLITILMLFICFFAYYTFMEFKFQRTIAKMMTNTYVICADGQKPSLSKILGRTFCRLIPFDNVSYLFTSSGFHDYLSSTVVVKGHR